MIQNIWCIGRNYGAHAKELGNAIPETPLVFLKAGSCVVETGNTFELPSWSKVIHHEVELALRFDKNLKIGSACVAIDLTARDVQDEVKKKGLPWTQAKSFRGACLIGDFFEIKSLSELDSLTLMLTVNGEKRQHGHVNDMIFHPEILVNHVLDIFPVAPGDLLLTGTPAGVSALESGDEIEAEIVGRSKGKWTAKRSTKASTRS